MEGLVWDASSSLRCVYRQLGNIMPEHPNDRHYHCEFISSIDQIDTDKFDQLKVVDNDKKYSDPHIFCSHNFLKLMEHSGAATEASGWTPHHLVVYDSSHKQVVTAFVPGYLKAHSMGEYIFDGMWYHTADRYQIDYYPRWVSAIPMTPCESNKFLLNPAQVATIDAIDQIEKIITEQLAEIPGANSSHLLFIPNRHSEFMQTSLWAIRSNVQYRWQNENYADFNGFLDTLKSRYRKKLKKERRNIIETGLEIQWFHGESIEKKHMIKMYMMYQVTHMKRGMMGHLPQAFFELLPEYFSDHLSLCLAKHDNEIIGGALFFESSDSLYGRYWGCIDYFHNLHFEVCYYQGMERCIEKGFASFDPGVQGEHKLTRGFLPTVHFSAHNIKHSGLHSAIINFCNEEHQYYLEHTKIAEEKLPYSDKTNSATRSAKNVDTLEKLINFKSTHQIDAPNQ